MLASPSTKSNLNYPPPRRSLAGVGISGAVGNGRFGHGFARFGNGLRIKAAISSGDRSVETTAPAPSVKEGKDGNGSLMGSSSSDRRIQVRAVLTIRRKIKEGLIDKVEDHWFSFVNIIGQGILLQLISEQIDPGMFSFYFSLVTLLSINFISVVCAFLFPMFWWFPGSGHLKKMPLKAEVMILGQTFEVLK